MLEKPKYDLQSAIYIAQTLEGCKSSKVSSKTRGRSRLSQSASETFGDGRMVHHPITNGRRMAPHPYSRKCPPVRPRSLSCSTTNSKKSYGDLLTKRPLQGLFPEQGKTSLPPEDIARIQNLVEPKFSIFGGIYDCNETPKPFQDYFTSESDRKRKILKYLQGAIDDVSIKSEDESESSLMEFNEMDFGMNPQIADNVFSVGQQLPDEVLMIADYQVASDQKVEQDFDSTLAQCEEAASPLSKLEEMKRLLPAVEMKGASSSSALPGSPGSPASSVSSGSSKEADKGPVPKKLVSPYSGIGQMYLWQFIVHALAKGEHGIAWVNQDACEFKFTHTDAIAKAWGRCKNNTNMTYEKMCRGLRGYYKSILRKVPDHRHVFQFIDEDVQNLCKAMQNVEGSSSVGLLS